MKKIRFKPNTEYRFTKSDMEFINELMKIGYVHLYSNQVALIDDNATSAERPHFFSFVEHGEDSCRGLALPEGWTIESVTTEARGLKMIFGVNHED